MRDIVRIRFGSHLYGTNTPTSDLDLKAVHVPSARDIILCAAKGSLANKRPKALGEKNFAGEADEESYSLRKYLSLVAEGQTVALDVLFAPPESMLVPPAEEWHEIVRNRHRLVSRKAAKFVGYCRQQANKYGIKGSRVAAARAALRDLDDAVALFGNTAKLAEIATTCSQLAEEQEHIAIVSIAQVDGGWVKHLEVCGRKLPFTSSIKSAQDIIRRLVDTYGHRALQAETQQGVDWKALSHAVRVATQAVELFQYGGFTFPLVNAGHILAIKRGELPYATVAGEIEQLLGEVETEAARSTLPDEPDHAWIEDFLVSVYRAEVLEAA